MTNTRIDHTDSAPPLPHQIMLIEQLTPHPCIFMQMTMHWIRQTEWKVPRFSEIPPVWENRFFLARGRKCRRNLTAMETYEKWLYKLVYFSWFNDFINRSLLYIHIIQCIHWSHRLHKVHHLSPVSQFVIIGDQTFHEPTLSPLFCIKCIYAHIRCRAEAENTPVVLGNKSLALHRFSNTSKLLLVDSLVSQENNWNSFCSFIRVCSSSSSVFSCCFCS